METPRTDKEFVEWIDSHSAGYVINSDKARKKDDYPMLHCAGCATYQEPNRYVDGKLKKYVTGDWDKFCSDDRAELENEGRKDPRRLKPCRVCRP